MVASPFSNKLTSPFLFYISAHLIFFHLLFNFTLGSGETKVLAAVYGPKAGTKKNENPEKACIEVIWKPKTGQIGEFFFFFFFPNLESKMRCLYESAVRKTESEL